MAEMKVEDVRPSGLDAAGDPIQFVYAKDVPLYAVYRTNERVLIHFSDRPEKREAQRRDLVRFNPIRGEINGIINGWRTSRSATQRSKAKRFDRRVADALTLALDGDLDGADQLLAKVKQDIIAERTSWARFLYLIVASGVALVILLLSGFVTSNWFNRAIFDYGGPPSVASIVWLAAGAGAVGAFFSIATAIRNRTILTDLQFRDNAADAVLRIVVGAIGGALLLLIIFSGTIGLRIGTFELSPEAVTIRPYSLELVMILGFIAGFSERLVNDLLAKITPQELAVQARVATATGGNPGGSGAAAAGTSPRPPSPSPPPPAPPAPAAAAEEDQPEADLDGCVSDIQPAAGEATGDAELPPATGGVEHAAAPAIPASPSTAAGTNAAAAQVPAVGGGPSS